MIAGEKLIVVFPLDGLNLAALWEPARNLLGEQGDLEKTYRCTDCPTAIRAADVSRYLSTCEERNAAVRGRKCTLQALNWRQYEFDQLSVSIERQIGIDRWREWVVSLLGGKQFLSACVVNTDYNFWQNEEAITTYVAEARPYNHLVLKPTGEEPPSPQLAVDTSRNPARRVYRNGYLEAVGAAIWLGDLFWKQTGVDRNAVEKTQWCQPQQLASGILELRVQEECFTSDQGIEADQQRKLRALLFPESDEAKHVL